MCTCDQTHFDMHPRGFRIIRFIGIAILGVMLAILLGLGLGYLIQWLWNILAVPLFKLPIISYWQAVGLFVLAKLLFGRVGGYGHGHGHHFHDRGKPWKRHGRHFREFWETEGRQAFEKYLERMQE